MITVTCPSCSADVQVLTANRQKQIECPECQNVFRVAPDNSTIPAFTRGGNIPPPSHDIHRTVQVETYESEDPMSFTSSRPRQKPTPPAPKEPTPAPKEPTPAPKEEKQTPAPEQHQPRRFQANTEDQADAAQGGLKGFSKTFKDAQENAVDESYRNYDLSPVERSIIPESDWKQVVEIFAWVAAIIGCAFLVFGSLPSGFLMDAGHDKRFLIALFMTAIAAPCFILSPIKRDKAIFFSVVTAITLLNLAYWLPIYVSPTKDGIPKVKTYSLGPIKNEPRFR